MKRVFEAQKDQAYMAYWAADGLKTTNSEGVEKGDLLILDDNKIDGWKMLPKNTEIKKRG